MVYLKMLTLIEEAVTASEQISISDDSNRNKRQAGVGPPDPYGFSAAKTRCPLLLVADYRFFREMGGGSTKTTINYLVFIHLSIIFKIMFHMFCTNEFLQHLKNSFVDKSSRSRSCFVRCYCLERRYRGR